MKRGSYWVSESGVLEFFILLGKTPKEVLHKLADITGHAPIPPYFSIGYHQSRWNYMTAEEVIDLNDKFDEAGIPIDSVWLDIEVLHSDNHKAHASKTIFHF